MDAGNIENIKSFVNIYEDLNGNFISDGEWGTWEDAYEKRDMISSYIETVEIVRVKK